MQRKGGDVPGEPSWRWAAPGNSSAQASQTSGGCYPSCPVDVTVTLGPAGLLYVGFCCSPAYGGGYTIGVQTVAEFLDRGPLRPFPPELVEEIRAYLNEHERPTATLDLVAVVADSGRRLVRVDDELDGVWITANRPLSHGDGDEVVFFVGSVPAGEHTIGAAFVTQGAAPNLTQSPDVAFAVAAGERLRIVFTIDGSATTVVTSRTLGSLHDNHVPIPDDS